MKRRQFATFSLSFIDAILCGFGAVILLFLIINAQSRSHRIEQTLALRAEVDTLQAKIDEGRRNLVQIRNTLDEHQVKIKRFEGLSRQVIEIQQEKQQQLARLEKDNISTKAHINRLRSDVKSSKEANKRLEAGGSTAVEQGERLREHAGEGQRQYLTGLNLNGKRTLILLDSSASMLAETIVNAVVRKNLPDAQKIRSAKWRRALAIIDWISTQLPPNAEFQLYSFNKKAFAVLPGKSGEWLSTSDPQALNEVVRAARKLVPQHGTDLAGAFSIASRLSPKADNILLITDGLPTLGTSKNRSSKVSSNKRLVHFQEAVLGLPGHVAVNTIMLPMEGDPEAAPAFWLLATKTGGSFFTPARDWP